MFKHILLPTDFGTYSARATELGIELAKTFDAALTLVHAYEFQAYTYESLAYVSQDLLGAIETAARDQLDKTLASVRTKLPAAKSELRTGIPWQQILAAIEDTHADLVVMGTHGRRGISHALLGSVTEKIVRMSPVPVLTVRETSH